jgi:predicted AAA+ superfamily ATPase
LYINFEDERLAAMKATDLNLFLECYKELYDARPVIFLDKIQNISGWEKFARRLADTKYRVFITGSNAKMLSREIYTTLGGRFIAKEISPFSFREYLSFNNMVLGQNWQCGECDAIAIFSPHKECGKFGRSRHVPQHAG